MLFDRNIKLVRRGYTITIPSKVYKEIEANGLTVSLIINQTGHSTVQLSKDNKYVCTLKSALNITGFKNGNNMDFRKSNTIMK